MRYRRAIIPGATYFFTVNLENRESTLLTTHINELRYAFQKVKMRFTFTLDAIVVLPDHLHAIMTLPENDANYALRWNLIKGTFSKQIDATEAINSSRKNKRERGIWQRRFWEHLIRNELDYMHHVNYIHYNPVKHGYVITPVEWKFSSIHRFIQHGVLPHDWAGIGHFNGGEFGDL